MPAPPVFAEVFADLDDPRRSYRVRHRLDDLLLITLCATICGAESFYAVEAVGRAKRSWLDRLIDLSHGVPSHDTLGRLFAALDPRAFERCFAAWMARLHERTAGEVVAIDGKTLRHSYHAASGLAALQMVNAFACANHLVLGEVAVEHGRGETTALPAILALLDLHGCVVTLDAAGCHADVARQIVDAEADYVIALKGNHPTLHDDVTSLFERSERDDGLRRVLRPLLHEVQQTDGGHGRVEVRRCRALGVDETGLLDAPAWPGLRSVVEVESTRYVGESVSVERRYYVSSLPAEPERLLDVVRSHWEVENRVHWVLDVTFSEDGSRVRLGHGAANLGTVRRLSLNALRLETSVKGSIATRRLQAGWDEGYLEKVLAGRPLPGCAVPSGSPSRERGPRRGGSTAPRRHGPGRRAVGRGDLVEGVPPFPKQRSLASGTGRARRVNPDRTGDGRQAREGERARRLEYAIALPDQEGQRPVRRTRGILARPIGGLPGWGAGPARLPPRRVGSHDRARALPVRERAWPLAPLARAGGVLSLLLAASSRPMPTTPSAEPGPSPLRSMTGFGGGTAHVGAVAATVEVRAVNGRFAEVTLRAPRVLGPHEAALTAAVKEVLERGNATVHVALDTPEATAGLGIDAPSTRAYVVLLRQLREAAGLDASEAPITLADLLRQPDLLVAAETDGDADGAWAAVQPALSDALAAFDAMRLAEGAALHADLAAHIDALERLLADVEARAPERVAEARRKTDERLAALLADGTPEARRLDPARLDAEVALLADKLDVTEECVRLRSHLAQFRDALVADEAVGRRLGFLAQEFNREINTIGSKANDAAVAQLSVAMKEALEKIREQISNVL